MMELRGWQIALAGIENFFLFNTAASVAAFAVAYLLRRGRLMESWRPGARARVFIAALAIPPVASAWVVCASLFPALWLSQKMWAQEHAEEHSVHLLNAFTVVADPMLGYATITFTLAALLVATWAAWRAYFRLNQLVECLEIGAKPAPPEGVREIEAFCRRHGISVGLVVSDYPFSFVWGYLRSKLIVSTGLLNALTKEELIAVLEHEAAHHERRDNLLKWALTICRYSTPAFPLTARLYRWLNEQIEMVCDEVAVRRSASPVDLAGALVRLKRLTLASGLRAPRLSGSGFLGADRESFERRVTRALSFGEAPPGADADHLSRSCVRTAFAVGAMFALSLIALFSTSPLAVHRAMESILRILHI
ncbi:MAG TPA: M48 family metalloprotease [Blastocatellia bacterium]|nr:M48 family metalloprotease [Blastocatellia bacterium]